MPEFNLLDEYPKPSRPRYVGPDIRTIHSRIIASYRGKEYYDGDRQNGYGGYYYDGRWIAIAKKIVEHYDLRDGAKILNIGAEKGFLMNDLYQQNSSFQLSGIEVSEYAIKNAMPTVRSKIIHDEYRKLNYEDDYFDLVIAIGVVYTLNLGDAITCIKEIARVTKGDSFITLGAYKDAHQEQLLRWWSVLGATLLHVDEWREVLKHAGYRGDYSFVTAESLNLQEAAPHTVSV